MAGPVGRRSPINCKSRGETELRSSVRSSATDNSRSSVARISSRMGRFVIGTLDLPLRREGGRSLLLLLPATRTVELADCHHWPPPPTRAVRSVAESSDLAIKAFPEKEGFHDGAENADPLEWKGAANSISQGTGDCDANLRRPE